MNFKVHNPSSGHEFTTAVDENILDAAIRAGREYPYGCRSGNCGACKARLLQGRIDYPEGLPEGLPPADHEAGYILLCQARACSDIEIEARELKGADNIPVRSLPSRVERKQELGHDVMGLWLRLPKGQRLQFLAGQYIEIMMKDGRARAFSLANPPHADELLELHIRHYPGGVFSDYVFHDMPDKTLLRFKGPMGHFTLDEDSSRPMVFIAGGTGFAPIKSIIEHALAEGIRRPMHLYWGVRAMRDLYLHDLALQWASDHPHLRYTPVLSEPLSGDAWNGRTGFVHQAATEDIADFSGHDAYVCGPPVMVHAAHDALIAAGLPEAQFFSDAFEFSPDAQAAAAQAKRQGG